MSPYATPLAAPRAASSKPLDEHCGPVPAALVSPIHLPALHHVAADLDGITAPIHIVAPADLGTCEDCRDEPQPWDEPARDAVATVHARALGGRVVSVAVCALHLAPALAWFERQGMPVHVTVPATGGRQWFERSERETWYAVDDSLGVVVARDVSDTWTVYLHRENHAPEVLAARMGVSGPGTARERAEVLGQAYAAQLATDAALAADVIVGAAA